MTTPEGQLRQDIITLMGIEEDESIEGHMNLAKAYAEEKVRHALLIAEEEGRIVDGCEIELDFERIISFLFV